MVNWLKTILDPSSTTSSIFAGDVMNWVIQYHSDVDLAAGDPLGIVKVATETIFGSGKLKLYDSNKTHSISLTTPDFTENKTVNIPSTLPTTDDMVTRTAVQSLTNKQIDYNLNTILNMPGFAAGSSISFTGTGSQTVFNIPHSLSGIPSIFFAFPKTADALGDYTLTADATNVIITYSTAPPTGGSNNVQFVWGAGGASGESTGFSASSVSTLTNKKIGDFLGYIKQGSTPANPATEEAIVYFKAVDASNNGMFVKLKRAGAIVEVQIA